MRGFARKGLLEGKMSASNTCRRVGEWGQLCKVHLEVRIMRVLAALSLTRLWRCLHILTCTDATWALKRPFSHNITTNMSLASETKILGM